MQTTQSNEASETIHQIREQFNEALKRQADQIGKLAQGLKSLQSEQQRLEEAAFHLVEPLESSIGGGRASSPSGILAGVRKLATAAYAGQVFEVLAEEAARLNVRSVVFDVRGRAAWASASGGFDPELPAAELRTLAVPLNQEGPFHRAFEALEAVETNAASLENHRNVLAMLTPAAAARILLVPVRSSGAVAAILYADGGEDRESTVIDALKILAEFAGAQMDRMMALSAGLAPVETASSAAETELASEIPPTALQSEAEVLQRDISSSPEIPEAATTEARRAAPLVPASEPPVLEGLPEAVGPADIGPVTAEGPAIAPPPEAEEKVHRDARRFSKLLVSEIELYNKTSVEEGRRNKDLYQRLKKDIDRSRETYEKRFGRTVAKQADYFHEELVRTLAENDPALLGPGYPGPMA